MTNFQKTWYDEIYESDTKFPQLFIYSTGDDIIDYKGIQSKFQHKSLQCLNCSPIGNFQKRFSGSTFYSDVDELVEQRRKINRIFVQKFGSNSPHVSHLRHNEEKYKEVLKCFLSKVSTSNNNS